MAYLRLVRSMSATIDAVAQFAAEAARFRDWARDGTDSGELAVRNTLVRVMTLYFTALELPLEWSDELDDAPDAKGISDDERWAIDRSIAARLPFSDYARVFDPFVFPPEEPVAGPISDDIADIYREVVGGLIEYKSWSHCTSYLGVGFRFAVALGTTCHRRDACTAHLARRKRT